MLASYMAKKKHKEIKLYHILIVVAVIIALWALGWLIPAAKFGDSSGSFGDTFGGINALFQVLLLLELLLLFTLRLLRPWRWRWSASARSMRSPL